MRNLVGGRERNVLHLSERGPHMEMQLGSVLEAELCWRLDAFEDRMENVLREIGVCFEVAVNRAFL